MLKITYKENDNYNNGKSFLLDPTYKDNYKKIENDNNLEILIISKVKNFTLELTNLPKLFNIEFQKCYNLKLILGKGLNKLSQLKLHFESVEIIDEDNNLDKLDIFSIYVKDIKLFLFNSDNNYYNKITDLYINFIKLENITIQDLNVKTIHLTNANNIKIILYNLPNLREIKFNKSHKPILILNENLPLLNILKFHETAPTIIDDHDYFILLNNTNILSEKNDIDIISIDENSNEMSIYVR